MSSPDGNVAPAAGLPKSLLGSSIGPVPQTPAEDVAVVARDLPLLIHNSPSDAPDFSVTAAGSVTEALSSATAVSVFSSLTFHLFTWALALILIPFLGLDWVETLSFDQRPLQAALGEENVSDAAALFEVTAQLEADQAKSPSSIEQLAKELQQSDSGWLQSSLDNVWQGFSDSAADDAANGGGVLLKMPEAGLAVTKGSFTAFTLPANPQPRQPYSIVIEIRLPDGDKVYRVTDLSGKVVGSDGYTQKLPYDSRVPGASGYPVEKGGIKRLESRTVLDVVRNRVQIIIKVPGGAQLVRDVISVRSRKLKEEQELELVFGRTTNTSESESKSASEKN
ncbi:MAG: hypothetical protein WCK86_08655 [Planctomycetia bacterium]